MGWDRGRYYTRSRKVGGRVVREYVGIGRVAELAAQMDALARENRRLKALELRREKADLAALDDQIERLIEMTALVARAALLAAGYHQHKRGKWRKKREQNDHAEAR
jgi:hypothetical protein